MAVLRNIAFLGILLVTAFALTAQTVLAERIKDVANVEGVHANALIGYGLVVGLDQTGDTYNSSPFTINSIVAMLQRFGINVQTELSQMKPENVAAVMVTAELPPFARPGQQLDITVSSMGNATSLRGGTLLITPLVGGDGKVYAVAQGAVSLGGFSISGQNASQSKNHPTAGKIPNGGSVERAAPNILRDNQAQIILDLRQPDFNTAENMQDAINAQLGPGTARAVDAGTVEVKNTMGNAVELLARVEPINITTDHPAIVVIDERTGTIVMGQDVRIDTVAVAHGNISVSITNNPQVSQPGPFSSGQTTTVHTTNLQVKEQKAKLIVLHRMVSLSDLVSALNAVGATPSDLIAVLQAIKAAGALHAELKII